MTTFDQEVRATQAWFDSPRFAGIVRLHSARQVVEQRGTIANDYTVAREAAAAFYARLRELFAERKSITTFGPYSPGQAVAMKRLGIEGIYLGGWATSAKGSITEDPGPDLASYPLSQVPDEAAALVRALLTADRNQHYLRSRMSDKQRAATPEVDYRPFIIADADTGHGGDPHVRNLIRRFVEVGVPGYHIEDQRPGTKKCGHQGGKVLVACDEQIKRLNAARFQLDVMGVPGIIVARTDAEAANLLDGRSDERDQPFILGATNSRCPSYKAGILALMKRFNDAGVSEVTGHRLYAISRRGVPRGRRLARAHAGWRQSPRRALPQPRPAGELVVDADVRQGRVDASSTLWEAEAGLKTFGEAVADVIDVPRRRGRDARHDVDEWRRSRAGASLYGAREKARSLGVDVIWDCELRQDPRGLLPDRGGIQYAIAKSLAAAPFADILWMETKTADLTTRASSPTRSTRCSPTRCSPTTSRRRSTGTPPA